MLTGPPIHISRRFKDTAQRGHPAALRAQGWRLRPELQFRRNHGAFCQREEEEKGETIPPSPSLSSTEPGLDSGTQPVSLLLQMLIPLLSAPPPGLCSCRGVGAEPPSPFSRDAPRGRALLSCPGRAGSAAGRQLSSLRSAAAGARGSCWGVTDTSMTHFPCLFPLFPFSNPRTSFLLQSAFRPGNALPAGSAQKLGFELPAVPQRLQVGTWGSRHAQHQTGRVRPRF